MVRHVAAKTTFADGWTPDVFAANGCGSAICSSHISIRGYRRGVRRDLNGVALGPDGKGAFVVGVLP